MLRQLHNDIYEIMKSQSSITKALPVLFGFFASSVFSIIYSMALQDRPEKANQISGLMITAIAGGGIITPIIGFAIGTVGIIGGVFVTLLCVLYLVYCAFGLKINKA